MYVPQMHSLPPGDLLDRLAVVSALLHEEQGNREELQTERTGLIQEARRRGILQSHATRESSERV